MALSLFQLASLVQNNVSGGLHGEQNFTYSLEQLKDELTLERNGALRDLERKGERPPLAACAQALNALSLAVADYSGLPGGVAELAGLEDLVRRPVLSFTFPPLLQLGDMAPVVRYVGPLGRHTPWRMAWKEADVLYDAYKRPRSVTPLVFFNASTPGQAWVFGAPVAQRTVSLTAVFADPLLVGHYPPHVFTDESEYPLPDNLARDIVQRLTNKYISMYGRLSPQPNTGTARI